MYKRNSPDKNEASRGCVRETHQIKKQTSKKKKKKKKEAEEKKKKKKVPAWDV